MKKRLALAAAVLCVALAACASAVPEDLSKVDALVSFQFDTVSPLPNPKIVYAVWIEDEAGNNLQNLYICNRVAKPDLTGDALPNWSTVKAKQIPAVDAVSGASLQSGFKVTRDLAIGSVTKFRVCFEVDRSTNGNDYFTDRPAFTYATELIDSRSVKASYPLSVIGWMANNTTGSPYGQYPQEPIPDFETYKFMTDLSYIGDKSGSLKDMVESATVQLAKK
jgi:hypothetical protein